MDRGFKYQYIFDKFNSRKKEIKRRVKKLKKKTIPNLDLLFKQVHEEIFEEIDCIECALCCTSLGPLLKKRDIGTMAALFSMKSGDFEKIYLKIDSDGDFVFKEMPCPMIGHENLCLIYSHRPDACARYPYTDQRRMKTRWNILLKDCSTCPAVIQILERVINRAEAL